MAESHGIYEAVVYECFLLIAFALLVYDNNLPCLAGSGEEQGSVC